MAINNQFSIAVHLMVGLGYRKGEALPSSHLAESVNAHPSFVRRTIAKLSKARLVRTTMGKSGACALAKEPAKISLLDIYRAVEAPKAFAIHDYPECKECPVSRNIKSSMEKVLTKTQKAMEESLKKVTLAELITELKAG